ncbi:MAG: class I SAM-dependent methyltransferase [Clostridia bacterium]|nr:class I SAM-dependent methyltransferase [Clostridia bacterium]
MWLPKSLTDYELIDTSDGARLERWGDFILSRPDPQVIWKNTRRSPEWKRADAVYHRSNKGGGAWDIKNKSMPDSWTISTNGLVLCVKTMGFKHTGVFPEQAVNWEWAGELIRNAGRPIKVLNLFAYTGGATMACAAAGASVCHVDASKGMVAQAKENARLSGLENAPIRYIVDDCAKFVTREIRRGNRYDAIILDPPSYGRGPTGEVWKIEDSIGDFLELCREVLSDEPLFVLLNSYTTGLASSTMAYLLHLKIAESLGGSVTADEIGLVTSSTGMPLGCGASARWTK